jgi:hypothetical protein
MKALKVWLLILSLISSGLIFPVNTTYADTEVDNPDLFETTAEGDLAVEEMMASVIPLCKDERGFWKNEIIKLPLNNEEFNCASLRKMEFDMLSEQGNPESEKRALICASRGLDAQGKLEFARSLETLEALQLPLEEHFACPGKKESMTDCLADITCNAVNMVLDQATLGVASWIAEQLSDQKGICPTTTQTNCFDELIYGVVKNVVTNIEGLISLGKMAYDGIKSGAKAVWNWITSAEEPSRDQHHVLQEETDQGILDWISDAAKKVKETVAGIFSAMGTMIDQGIKDNFGCNEWSESRYSPVYGGQPRCLDPVVSWGCATCSQKMNMSCGIVGFVGGEIVTAYLTGGTVGLIKAGVKAGAASKVAQGIAKTQSFQKLAKGASVAAKPFAASGKALVGVLRLSGKAGMSIIRQGQKWALKIGNKFLKISDASKLKILRMMAKGKDLATKPFRAYFGAMERAFAAGYHGSDGVIYLMKARKLASGTTPTRTGAELLDYATDSAKYNTMKSQLTKTNDEFNKVLLEYNNTLKGIKELGPDEAARIAKGHIERLNQLKADKTRLVAELSAEKKNIEAALVAANNTTDVSTITLNTNRTVRQTPVRTGSNALRTPRNTGVTPQLTDNVPLAGNVSDDIARTFKPGDQVDLVYKSGNQTKTAIIVRETDKQLIVRYAGEGPDVTHRINKVYLDLDQTFRYNNPGLVADDVIIPYRPTTDAIAAANRQGAIGDVVRLKYNNSANGIDGFITGTILRETDDTIWIVNASNPTGRPVRKINLDLERTRNFFDTRHLNATRNLQPEDAISFSVKGKPVNGEVIRLNQKSIRIKDKLGNIKTYEMNKIDLGSITSKAIDPVTGARLTAASTATGLEVLDEVGQTARLTTALKAKYSAMSQRFKPFIDRGTQVTLNIKDKAQQVGRIMSQGDDFIRLKTATGEVTLKYKDILKLTVPARLSLAFNDNEIVYTDLTGNTPRTDTDPIVIPGGNDAYDMNVAGSLNGDDVSCVATVSKGGSELSPEDFKNKVTLKWTGQECNDSLSCNGKLSEGFNNIEVILEITDKPDSPIKKICQVTVPSEPNQDQSGDYDLLLTSNVDQDKLICTADARKGGDQIFPQNNDKYEYVWVGQEENCGSSNRCEGFIANGFNNIVVKLKIDGKDESEWPAKTCSGQSQGESWNISGENKQTADELVCQFTVTKNGQAATPTADDKVSITFDPSEGCNAETLECKGPLASSEMFKAMLKKEGDPLTREATCEKTSARDTDTDNVPRWSLTVEHEYDEDDEKHYCSAKVKLGDENLDKDALGEKGYKLIWEEHSSCQTFKCADSAKENEMDDFDVYLVKDGEESTKIKSATCSEESEDDRLGEDSEDIYNTNDEEEEEDTTAPRNFGQFHNYGPGTPLIPPQPTMLPPPMTYFHANFN